MSRNKKNYLVETDSYDEKCVGNETKSQYLNTMKPEQPSIKINIVESSNTRSEIGKFKNAHKIRDSDSMNKSNSFLKPECSGSISSKLKKDNVVIITSKLASKNSTAIQIDFKDNDSANQDLKGAGESDSLSSQRCKKNGHDESSLQINLLDQVKDISHGAERFSTVSDSNSNSLINLVAKHKTKPSKVKKMKFYKFGKEMPLSLNEIKNITKSGNSIPHEQLLKLRVGSKIPFRDILRLKYLYKDIQKIKQRNKSENEVKHKRVFAAYIPKRLESSNCTSDKDYEPKKITLIEDIMIKDKNYDSQKLIAKIESPKPRKKVALSGSKTERLQPRATNSGFPQRNSIGALKMFTARKVRNTFNCSSRARNDPKWKKFLEKVCVDHHNKLSVMNFLQNTKTQPFKNELLNPALSKKRLQTSNTKYHNGRRNLKIKPPKANDKCKFTIDYFGTILSKEPKLNIPTKGSSSKKESLSYPMSLLQQRSSSTAQVTRR
ncbi:unnamed protein product [Moneuplotes crassus]|uniref:Uncharacterized protein n=1 Tax=Euplotes crassus TaxID=5936 RepID=A0AAD1X6E4_EUPCR|nr:unnamed protein product [Moneuplotes crassus]